MYYYIISSYDPECGSHTTLMHDKEFSKEEFDKVVAEAYAIAYANKKHKAMSTIGDLWGVKDILVEQFGFQDIVATHVHCTNAMVGVGEGRDYQLAREGVDDWLEEDDEQSRQVVDTIERYRSELKV